MSGIIGFLFSACVHHEDQPITETIQTFHYPASFVQQLKGDKAAGHKIFKEFCTSCHGIHPIIDVHAPHIDDKMAWNKLQKLDRNTLLQLTIQGVGAMPARGGCFECSDAQLQETIDYILKQSQKGA